VEKYCRAGQATVGNMVRGMRTARWITKATDTHSEYVMVIAFPLQQYGSASVFRYIYIYIQGDSGGICNTLGNDSM
jgi:hypothetical protein